VLAGGVILPLAIHRRSFHVHLLVAGRKFGRLPDTGARQHACRSECLEGQRQQQEADEQRSDDGFHTAILARVAARLA
jgi:hypothetical protein